MRKPSLDNYSKVRNAERLGAEVLFIPIHGQGGQKGGPRKALCIPNSLNNENKCIVCLQIFKNGKIFKIIFFFQLLPKCQKFKKGNLHVSQSPSPFHHPYDKAAGQLVINFTTQPLRLLALKFVYLPTDGSGALFT